MIVDGEYLIGVDVIETGGERGFWEVLLREKK